MAGQAPPRYPSRRDYQILGLHQAMTEKNRQMLRQVLVWGTPRRQPGQRFSEYLLTMKGIPENELRKRFNKGQKDKLDNDPHMNSFDVSLIYQCLKFGADGLAPPNDVKWNKDQDTLESRLTAAKNYRNDFAHGDYVIDDQLYLAKIEEIRNLLTDIINKAACHFGRDKSEVAALLKDFNEDLNKIRDLPISASRLTFEQLCTLLKIEGRLELEKKYKTESSMSPASNLLGKRVFVKVKQIFTKIEMHRENNPKLLDVERLFVYVNSLSSRKNVLLVEGVAGAGKTTLTRMILQEWSERSGKMKNLDDYDLAIWTECRDGGTPSLAQLLYSLMPIATKEIQGDAEVVKGIQKSELLFLVDGLDELNASSERVFREILALKNTDIITVICTTRPNKVFDIMKYVPDSFEIQHLKLMGIAEQDREDFVINYIRALESQLGTTDTFGLFQFLKRKESRLQEHWRLPFNLVLVTILWLQSPNTINEMTTATELFLRTFELCKERLIQRLQDNEATSRLRSKDIRENVSLFVKVMTNVAFSSHYDDETVLSEASVETLREACKHQNLPHEEVLGAFLVQTTSFIDENLDKISFPHKGLQDFFCALHIEEALDQEHTKLDIPGIISSFEQLLLEKKVPKARIPSLLQEYNSKFQEETSNTCPTVRSLFEEALKGVAIRNSNQCVQFDLRKWRNVLVHLTGLLHHRGRSLTDERAEEMVKLLQESGITDSAEWFNFLYNVKCDAAISKHIVLRGSIEVTDARVEAFLKVLDRAEPNMVDIGIEGDPSTTPGLEELLVALQKKDWETWLSLHHDFRVQKEGGSVLDGTLCNLFRSNLKLTRFKGQLGASALKELPAVVNVLWLSVKDGAHFRSLLPVLTAREQLPTWLPIHVPVDIDGSSLRPLPRGPSLRLFVSGVGEATAEKASAVARALLPSGDRYSYLCFPGVGRTLGACERLVEELGRRGVEVDLVYVSPSMEMGEEERMEDLARRKLDCGFYALSEDEIWKWW